MQRRLKRRRATEQGRVGPAAPQPLPPVSERRQSRAADLLAELRVRLDHARVATSS